MKSEMVNFGKNNLFSNYNPQMYVLITLLEHVSHANVNLIYLA